MLPIALILATAVRADTEVNGLVVDRDGQGVDKADVRFYAEYDREIGHARADGKGRFSVKLPVTPETWSAGASGYQTQTLRFSDLSSLTIVLYPREPKPPGKIEAADLAVLPYQDVGYAFSLVPFAVIQGGGAIGVGDRGLSGSANALENNGSSFDQIPAHYLSFAGIADAFHSYRYGTGAAGHYTLGFDRAAGADAQIGTGSLRLQTVQGRSGDAAFGYGNSAADLTERSRSDFVSRSKVGAGKVLFTFAQAYEDDRSGTPEETENETDIRLRLDEPWLGSVATFEVKADRKNKYKLGDYVSPESEVEGEFRLRNDGALFSNEFGAKITRDTGARSYSTKMYSGVAITNRLFASETYNGNRFSAQASLEWYGLRDAGVTHKMPAGVSQNTGGIAASLGAQWQFSDRFALAVTRGDIEDTPSVSDQYFGDPIPALVLNRGDLTEGSLLYRAPGGFAAELTAYAEKYATALPTTHLSGQGLAVDWPIARSWRLRAWTLSLRDAADGLSQADLGPSFGRDVAWLTYYGGKRARFDVIYRRETDSVESGRYVDADAALEIGPRTTLIGTMEHHRFTSSYGLSLRFNAPKP